MKDRYQNLPFTAEANLRLFAAAVDAASNGIVITDHLERDYPIIYCNAAFEQMTGYSQPDIIGHNCRLLQGDDRDQKGRQLIKAALSKGEGCQVEMRNYKKDGTLFWNELVLSPVKDSEGIVTHYIGVQNDITRRKQAELTLEGQLKYPGLNDRQQIRDLEENEAYLAGIVETIRESMLVLDQEINVIRVNEHFCKFFKVNEQEVIGRPLAGLCQGAWDIPALADLLNNILPHSNPFEGFELERNFPYIGKKTLLLNARQMTLKGKYQKRILLAIEDITQWREQEQRKESFITLASHELKTPLTNIKAHVELLKRKAEKNDDQAYLKPLETVYRSVRRLDDLINDLLEVAQLQLEKVPFRYSNVNFDDLLRECIDVVQGTTPTHQISISGEQGLTVSADFRRMEHVMLNLLSNAIKYSPQSKAINVHVKVLANFIKVSVSDNGIGISHHEQQKIFERFYRAENIQHYFQGIGIGLYICQQHVKEHNGTIWVESEPGKGSAFNFTLPINR